MTAQSKTTIKSYFETGDKPTQAQFADLVDSYQDADPALGAFTSAAGGLIVKTSSGGVATRGIAGTANEITVTDSVGSAGNPTISLPSSIILNGKTITGGTYVSAATATKAAGDNSTALANTAYADNAASIVSASVGKKLLSSGNLVVVSSLDITSNINSNFNAYELELYNLYPATDGNNLWIRVSEDGGSTFKAGGTDYGYAGNRSTDAAANIPYGSTGAAQIVCATSAFNGNASGIEMTVKFYSPGNSGVNKRFRFDSVYLNNAGVLNADSGVGTYKLNTNAINALRVMFSTGIIQGGSWALYGLKTS